MVLNAGKLLIQALRRQKTGAEGYFLLADDHHNRDNLIYYPLYFSTLIGKARSADIRIRARKIKRQHALIYLYNGAWYIQPAHEGAKIALNDKYIDRHRRLKHEDKIQIGKDTFSFIDERRSAKEAGVQYQSLRKIEAELTESVDTAPVIVRVFLVFYLLLSAFQLYTIIPSNLSNLKTTVVVMFFAFSLLLLSSAVLWRGIFLHFDSVTFVALSFLMSLGFILQMRLSILNRTMPTSDAWNETIWLEFLQADIIKQAIFPIIGLIIMPIIMILISRTRIIEKASAMCLVITPLLYIATKLFGRDVAGTGAALWIVLPLGFTVQLSEFAKISYILAFGWFFKNRMTRKKELFFFLWIGLNFLLILLLPDLGSIMILLPLSLVIFTVMTSQYIKTFLILIMGSGAFAAAYQFLPYVRNRIHGWLTLWTEVNAQNDQIIRGLQAIARGGIIGIGMGQGEPRSIPLASSDMIFSFLVEEQGLLTGLAIVMFFMCIWFRGAHSALLTRDSYSATITLGIASYFFVEAAVVIAGCTGLIPLTGVTMPFIARGGSSMLAKYMLAGILLGLWNRREEGAYRS